VKTVFLVRCHAFDTMARYVAMSLADAGADVVVVVDERKAVAETTPFSKISLNEAELASLGLQDLPPDWGWLCGDVCYYAARRHLPEATHFCLIESDVAFSANAAALFVQAVQNDPSDLLAAALGPRESAPKYSRGLRALGLDPRVGCYFPVTRCSVEAIDQMHDLRRRSITAGVAALTNDEAILCAAIQQGRLVALSLNELLPDLFTARTFATNPPHLAEAVHRYAARAAVYHPAIPLDVVLDRIATGDRGYSQHRLRQVLKGANADESSLITRAFNAVTSSAPRFALLARALRLGDLISVLDVGANPLIEGTAPYAGLLRAGLAKVYGFEPQADALAALNAARSDNETYFPDAVGNGESATLHLYDGQGFASLFAVDEDSARFLGFGKGARPVGTMPLVTRRLDDIVEIPPVDLLKIDVQGAETQVIAHGRDKLAQALVVITEMRMFPIYTGEPRSGDLEAELNRQGFEFLRFATFKHVPLSRRHRTSLRRSEFAQAVDGDAIFVRDLRKIATFDDDSLKKLALIADAVIDNADLTISVLEVLEDRGVIPATVIPDYLSAVPANRRR
jgi:FkbM family methyltransferase